MQRSQHMCGCIEEDVNEICHLTSPLELFFEHVSMHVALQQVAPGDETPQKAAVGREQ